MPAVRTETEAGVRSIVFSRPERYNTITPELRDELSAAIDAADADNEVRVILLRAEGKAFCAGYELEGSTQAQAAEGARGRVWDSVADYRMGAESRPRWLGATPLVELGLSGGRVLVRPSGTEPKLKVYVDLNATVGEREAVGALETELGERARQVGKDLVAALGALR